MRNLLAIISCCLLLATCQNEAEQPVPYFEGEINYSIILSESDAGVTQEELEQMIGTEMTAYFAEDKYVLTYNTSGQMGKTKIYHFLDKGIGYVELENSPAITQFRLDEASGRLLDFQVNGPTKEILGDSCTSITLSFESNPGTPDYTTTQHTYYYTPKYRLNSEKYSEYERDYLNRYMAEAQAVWLRQEVVNYPLYNAIIQATKIEAKALPAELFEFDQSKTIVE